MHTIGNTAFEARQRLNTHRVAIANSRLLDLDDTDVTFSCKDYRLRGRNRPSCEPAPWSVW